MKTNVYLGIAFRIILLFTVASLATYLPEQLRDYFGDVPFKSYVEGTRGVYEYRVTGDGEIDENWVWGARHYWYFWMMILLFILSVLNVIIGIGKLINKHYPNTF